MWRRDPERANQPLDLGATGAVDYVESHWNLLTPATVAAARSSYGENEIDSGSEDDFADASTLANA